MLTTPCDDPASLAYELLRQQDMMSVQVLDSALPRVLVLVVPMSLPADWFYWLRWQPWDL